MFGALPPCIAIYRRHVAELSRGQAKFTNRLGGPFDLSVCGRVFAASPRLSAFSGRVIGPREEDGSRLSTRAAITKSAFRRGGGGGISTQRDPQPARMSLITCARANRYSSFFFSTENSLSVRYLACNSLSLIITCTLRNAYVISRTR